MATDTDPKLVSYVEAQRRLGFCRRTFYSRLREAGITVYIDGTDRRQRLIDVRDLEKLTEIRVR